MNVVSTKSPERVPDTRTEYVPGLLLPTTKLPAKDDAVEFVITHDDVLSDMAVPVPDVIVQVVSPVWNRVPETLTRVPDGPEDGVIMMFPTAKRAEAVSPLEPCPVTV
jgi:hypothetical protein